MESTNNIIWTTILQSLGSAFIYAIVSSFTAYKAVMATVKLWIASQIKTSTEFIDTRVALQLKIEREELKQDNKALKDKIEILEHDYKLFNEERIKEMREFFKEYK